jgi:hypothetical protein
MNPASGFVNWLACRVYDCLLVTFVKNAIKLSLAKKKICDIYPPHFRHREKLQ